MTICVLDGHDRRSGLVVSFRRFQFVAGSLFFCCVPDGIACAAVTNETHITNRLTDVRVHKRPLSAAIGLERTTFSSLSSWSEQQERPEREVNRIKRSCHTVWSVIAVDAASNEVTTGSSGFFRIFFRISSGSFRISSGSIRIFFQILPDFFRISSGSLPDFFRISSAFLQDFFRISSGFFQISSRFFQISSVLFRILPNFFRILPDFFWNLPDFPKTFFDAFNRRLTKL